MFWILYLLYFFWPEIAFILPNNKLGYEVCQKLS